MSTAVAAPPTTSLSSAVDRHVSPRQFASFTSAAHSSALPSAERVEPAPKRVRSNGSPSSAEFTAVDRSNSNGKSSPTSCVHRQLSLAAKPGTDVDMPSRQNIPPPMIKVKKEPGSPPMASARPRPKRLDLSSSTPNSRGPQTARPSAPLTSRDSAGLAIQDVGLACLSPGFQTHDPAMREQLQRSLDVRDQQRQIIEARQKGGKPGSSHESDGAQRTQDTTLFGVPTRTPTTSRRKGPPVGLSIAAPSALQFANDRVIQSAPINQTFTGLRPGDHSYTRHAQHGPSGLSQMSHIHHVPATQTNNRLPSIADVFSNDRLDVHRGPGPLQSPSHPNGIPPVPSPGFGPPRQQEVPGSARNREFRSADEAVAGLSGGRDDLMPKVVHYGGVQPPTPPSPMNHQHTSAGSQQTGPHSGYPPDPRPDILFRTSSMNGRRRGREEFERDNGSPPSAFNRQEPKRTTFAVRGDQMDEDWKAGMSSAEKKEEFLRLCERAWDLFHS